MTIKRSDYAVVPLKSLNGIYENKSPKKEIIKQAAANLANKQNQVMVIIQVLHVIVPTQTTDDKP